MTEPAVIYEDDGFLAISKPAGLLVHPAKKPESRAANSEAGPATLAGWLLERYPELIGVGDDPATRPGIVHRLDRGTSGVMLVAKTQAYFEYLKSLFARREVEKKYLAVVFGKMREREGAIDKPIGVVSGSVRRSTRSAKMEKPAATRYRVLREVQKDGEALSLLEVAPLSGRTHQIRVHLASIGRPVVGDPLYGRRTQPKWAKRLMLHALSIAFAAAPGKPVKIEADPPAEFSEFLEPPE